MNPNDVLAALSDGRYYHSPADRPRQFKLDAGYSVELPSPRMLARVWALPAMSGKAEILSHSGNLARRPHGSLAEPTICVPDAAANELSELIEALPDRADARRHYRDLKGYIRDAYPAAARSYLLEVVAAVRIAAPKYRPIVERAARETEPKGKTERQRDWRHRSKDCAIWCARDWLSVWVATAAPGTRVDARELYAEAAEFIGADVADYNDDPETWYGSEVPRPVVPGSRIFYAEADKILGPRHRSAFGYAYVVPAPIADPVIETMSGAAWDETLTAIIAETQRT